jgi:hypothetical protein
MPLIPFPNVPNVPGVPNIKRAVSGVVNTLTGSLTGSLDPLSGVFSGNIAGFIAQSSGQTSAMVGTLRGVLDVNNNLNAALSGLLSGNVLGSLTGTVDRATGVIRANLLGVVSQLAGSFGRPAAINVTAAPPFQWGVFTAAGTPVLVGDSVAGLDYNREFNVATFPVERGTFESYNKVEVPFQVRVAFMKGGTVAEKNSFLSACELALASLDLYNVATPEFTYTEMNVVGLSYDRTAAKGAGLMSVEVRLQRIRAYAATAFTNTKSASGAADVNAGPVQPATPTPPQSVAVTESRSRAIGLSPP